MLLDKVATLIKVRRVMHHEPEQLHIWGPKLI